MKGQIMVNFSLIGKRIQQKRKQQNKTQENLAEYLDVSVGYVSLIERGKTKISLETLARISDFLTCSVSELIEDVSTASANYMNIEIYEKINMLDSDEKEMFFSMLDVYLKRTSKTKNRL